MQEEAFRTQRANNRVVEQRSKAAVLKVEKLLHVVEMWSLLVLYER